MIFAPAGHNLQQHGQWSAAHQLRQGHHPSPFAPFQNGKKARRLQLTDVYCRSRYWSLDNNDSLVYHIFNNSWKVDHYKVADAKKVARQRQQWHKRQKQLRVLYPVLVVLSAACGVLGAVYAGLCYLTNTSAKGVRRKRRVEPFPPNQKSSLPSNGSSSSILSLYMGTAFQHQTHTLRKVAQR